MCAYSKEPKCGTDLDLSRSLVKISSNQRPAGNLSPTSDWLMSA